MAINEDTIKGSFNEVVGKVEGAAGNAFGDGKTEVDGKITEMKGKAEQVYGKAKDVYGKASDTVKDWADRAPDAAREAREKATRLAEDGAAKVRTTVQEQPVAVLAGGIALGFVVGWLLSGRKN